MVLMPGRPEPEQGGPPVDSDPAVTRQVSKWQYFKFNAFYTFMMLILLPLTVQISTTPFFMLTTFVTFKFGIIWVAVTVPVAWFVHLWADILWMMLVKK